MQLKTPNYILGEMYNFYKVIKRKHMLTILRFTNAHILIEDKTAVHIV
jgi:hypothetical protein